MWVSLVTCLKCESCDLAPTLDPIVRQRGAVISDTHCTLGNTKDWLIFFLSRPMVGIDISSSLCGYCVAFHVRIFFG